MRRHARKKPRPGHRLDQRQTRLTDVPDKGEELAEFAERAMAAEREHKREIIAETVGPEELETLVAKLDPRRFRGMSPQMAAIVGYILGQKWTTPEIEGMVVTSDGFVLARRTGDIDHRAFIGALSDLERNWESLLDAADLTFEERAAVETLYHRKITNWRGGATPVGGV